MSEIEITLPTVQYGNVKVRATPEELGLDSVSDAAALGVATAVYLTTFTLGYKRGSAIDVDIDDSMAHAGSGPYGGITEEQAQRYLDEGLGGVTEISDEEFEQKAAAAEAEMGGKAPWDRPQVDSKPKPWETGSTTPAAKPVIGEDW